jgi:OPA family glycerol-3-phosphate transporter-like MFS transporter
MSLPPAFGTFLVYGIAALFSAKSIEYKWMFYLPTALLFAVGIIWFSVIDRTEKISKASEKTENKRALPKLNLSFVLLSVPVLLAAIANGFLKDGITTWTPSILKENYGMQESLSILITLFLPLTAIFGAYLATGFHKHIKNTYKINCAFYLAEALVLAAVLFLSRRNVTLSGTVLFVLLFAASAMLMNAVNNVVTAIIPIYARGKAESGLLAGVLDTFCYVGSMLSTGFLGFISDRFSWNGVFICLLSVGAAAFIICLISIPISRKNSI